MAIEEVTIAEVAEEAVHTCRGFTYKISRIYDTCTLLGGVLTWWNSHVRTVRDDAAYEMTWKSLMKMMIEVHCPRNEIRKLENKLWNLTVKGFFAGGGETDQDPSNIADDTDA
ncbi:reverse transcriptase domain-containing protein [Tanacetum coccineum]